MVHGDPHSRTLIEAMRDVVTKLAQDGGAAGAPAGECAAFRADFFVRWASPGAEGGGGAGGGGGGGAGGGSGGNGRGEGGEGARLWLNEVEHGFNPGCCLGWFGPRLTATALRAWTLGGDAAQRNAFLRQKPEPRCVDLEADTLPVVC